jgi:uncharacterized protein with HEPN domain
MTPMRDDRQRLLDVQEAIANIEEYATRGKEIFLRDRLIQVWFVHHLQIIGEAAAGLSRELRERNPDIPWGAAIAMRNMLVHEYFGIDLEEVWKAVTQDLPKLMRSVERILKDPSV